MPGTGHQSQETTGQAGMEQWHRRAQLTGVCGALFHGWGVKWFYLLSVLCWNTITDASVTHAGFLLPLKQLLKSEFKWLSVPKCVRALLTAYNTKQEGKRKRGAKNLAPKSTSSELCKCHPPEKWLPHLIWNNARDACLKVREGVQDSGGYSTVDWDFLSPLTYM